MYVPPQIGVVETETDRQLLFGSHATGGHDDADDEDFETFIPGSSGHQDADDEAFEPFSPHSGGHSDALDENW